MSCNGFTNYFLTLYLKKREVVSVKRYHLSSFELVQGLTDCRIDCQLSNCKLA